MPGDHLPSDDRDEQVETRAEPEEAAILRESEERVAAAAVGEAPGDAADEHRESSEGV